MEKNQKTVFVLSHEIGSKTNDGFVSDSIKTY